MPESQDTPNNISALERYRDATWLRALVQFVPYSIGSAVDVLLSERANAITQKRVEELISRVQAKVDQISAGLLNTELLGSEEFFEAFRTAAEISARSTSAEKRELVARYLSGLIQAGTITDLSAQVLEDLRFLQPIHLQVLVALPSTANQGISKQRPPESINSMPPGTYEKVVSDLERFGFIRYNTTGIGTYGGGAGHWETTEYVRIFREYIKT